MQNAVGKLFRSQNASSLRQSVASLTQTRSYSRNAIPNFSPTSSPELDDALQRFREEIFIPFGLNAHQRKLMSRQKYAERLEQQPVIVTIGENDETFQLRPMDPLSRPSNEDVIKAISLMKTTKDWQNIIPVLAGMRMSHRKLKRERWEWLVRKAGSADALGIILECAKQTEQTGFRLRKVGVVKRLFFELHRKAQVADFKGPETSKAWSLARQFVGLMEAPEHVVNDPQYDPKRRPFVIGVLLELSAARALNEFNGEDQGGLVRTYVQRLLASWPQGKYKTVGRSWIHEDLRLQEEVPIFNGMKLALLVNGIATDKDLNAPLKKLMNELGHVIKRQVQMAPEKIKEKPSLGYQQSQILFQTENGV